MLEHTPDWTEGRRQNPDRDRPPLVVVGRHTRGQGPVAAQRCTPVAAGMHPERQQRDQAAVDTPEELVPAAPVAMQRLAAAQRLDREDQTAEVQAQAVWAQEGSALAADQTAEVQAQELLALAAGRTAEVQALVGSALAAG